MFLNVSSLKVICCSTELTAEGTLASLFLYNNFYDFVFFSSDQTTMFYFH